ncbi:MAG: toxin-antitoxin system YwqK family antitoxin [Bacteroidales bacterium]|nr:toxin-antitoxin system YwqK family antitoxin [Bacteroidales bacterium]
MKKLFLIILSLFSVTLFAQVDTANINKKDASGRKQGAWVKYEDGKLAYKGQFRNDVPYGTFRYYHTDGTLKSETEFVEGVHKVKTTMYHKNGKKASEGHFVDQLKDGQWLYYSNQGVLVTEENYIRGVRNGDWKIYSAQSGVLLEERHYLNGHLNGVHKTYYEDGNVCLEENYIDGHQNGRCTSYYPTQKVSSTGEMLKGHRIGDWDFYDSNGKARSTIHYEDGRDTKHYIYLYRMGVGQKLNQDLVAYFLKKDDQTTQVVLHNGKKLLIDESLEDVETWADFLVFTRISPRIISSNEAIVGYKPVDEDDAGEDAIIVKLRPRPDEEIYTEGVYAKMIKNLFNTSMPEE